MAVGIICEFNPFHNGHEYLISHIKKRLNKPVLCVMSGEFVQRGEAAAFSKEQRAKWAIKGGADLVLELPFPFCTATAQLFAACAISIISASGACDTLAFGVEGDYSQEDFFKVARLICGTEFQNEIKKAVKQAENQGYAEIREALVREKLGESFSAMVSQPNCLLGVEYAAEIIKQGAALRLEPVPRTVPHDGKPNEAFCSASHLRNENSICDYKKYCPDYVSEYAAANQKYSLDENKYFTAICRSLLFMQKQELCALAEMPHDYVAKLKECAGKASNLQELFEMAKARHITNAKLRRMLLYLAFDVKKEDFATLPKCSMLLAHSKEGSMLLKKIKEAKGLAVLSRLSDIKRLDDDMKKMYEKQLLAERMLEIFSK